jgi:2-hydroxychromene-2-carboxylate isomerase
MQETYNQINELLKPKFPLEEDRNKIIADMGELIISETYVEVLESITNEVTRGALVNALNTGNQEEVMTITESLGIDLFAMLQKKSKQVLEDVIS